MIHLWVVEWAKAGLSLLIPLYFWKMTSYSAGVWNMPLFLLIIVLLGIYLFRSKREKADERAVKSMLRANSICYKIALVFMALVVLPKTIVYGADSSDMGYYITLGISALTIIRASLFCWFDKMGVG